jgi:DNA-binding transcriptional regulator YhcF (GntR family)
VTAELRPLDALRAVRDLAHRPGMQPGDKGVLSAIILRLGEEGTCWPSYARLAADTWLSLRTVKESVARLVREGFLVIEKRWRPGSRERMTNVYRVNLPEVVQQAHYVVQEPHDVVRQVHQVVQELHEGGAPAARRSAHEVPRELPKEEIAPLALTPSAPKAVAPLKKATPKHAPEQTAAKCALVDAFIARVDARKGVKPDVSHGADQAAAYALVKKYGVDEAVALVSRALDDPFVLNSNCTLRYIASKPDSWRGLPHGGANLAKPSIQPPTGSWAATATEGGRS